MTNLNNNSKDSLDQFIQNELGNKPSTNYVKRPYVNKANADGTTTRTNTGTNSKPSDKAPFVKKGFTTGSRFARSNKFEEKSFKSLVISVRTVAKTNAGGRRRRTAVLLATYDDKRKLLGLGTAKGNDFAAIIKKAEEKAVKNAKRIKIDSYNNIYHNNEVKHCSLKVLINKTRKGSGLKAGGIAYQLLEMIGLDNLSCKIIGKSKSKYNITYGVFKCLTEMEDITEISNRLNLTTEQIKIRNK